MKDNTNKTDQITDEIELTEQELEMILAGHPGHCPCPYPPPPINRPPCW